MARDSEATRARILDAAEAEFAAYGIAGSRVDRIADAALANKALIYKYFGTKDDLFDAVFAHRVLAFVDEVEFDATDLPRSPGGLLQADAHCRVPGWDRVYVAGDSGSFPGPDWMPKQAHMADLQAEAAVENLAADLRGEPSSRTFDVELMCIVDGIEHGTMVWRTPRRNVVLPPSRIFHWAKRAFERRYLSAYR